MLRCASYLVVATYEKVGLAPRYSRALPLKLFTRSLINCSTRCGIINLEAVKKCL